MLSFGAALKSASRSWLPACPLSCPFTTLSSASSSENTKVRLASLTALTRKLRHRHDPRSQAARLIPRTASIARGSPCCPTQVAWPQIKDMMRRLLMTPHPRKTFASQMRRYSLASEWRMKPSQGGRTVRIQQTGFHGEMTHVCNPEVVGIEADFIHASMNVVSGNALKPFGPVSS